MKKMPRSLKSIVSMLVSILTGGGIFFAFYMSIHNGQFSSKNNKQLIPQEILDHAVNSSGVKETKSFKKEKNEIIFKDNK